MFKRARRARRRVGFSTSGVGIHASSMAIEAKKDLLETEEFEPTMLDLLDLDSLFSLLSPISSRFSKEKKGDMDVSNALSVVSLGVGAATMFGSRTIGIQACVEAFTRAFDLLGSRAFRKFAAPLVGLMST